MRTIVTLQEFHEAIGEIAIKNHVPKDSFDKPYWSSTVEMTSRGNSSRPRFKAYIFGKTWSPEYGTIQEVVAYFNNLFNPPVTPNVEVEIEMPEAKTTDDATHQ
jgi:hypothetical protein